MTKKQTYALGIRERLTAIRKHLDLNQRVFAQKVGCHRNRISDIERGLREVPKNIIFALCSELNIDLNWLVLGKGPMFQNESRYQSNPSSQASDQENEFLKKLIEEKEKQIAEKEAHIKLQGQMLNSQ